MPRSRIVTGMLLFAAMMSARSLQIADPPTRNDDMRPSLMHRESSERSLPSEARLDCTIRVDPHAPPTHRIDRHVLGCHSDAGYAHEARGLYAELVYGAAFEWVPDTDPTNGSAAATTPLHGWAGAGGATLDPNASQIPGGTSLRLVGPATATNRGFGNEGLYLVGAQPYDGYLVLQSDEAVEVTVTLEHRGAPGADPSPLAQSVLQFPGGNWTRLNFSLTPATTADCIGVSAAEAAASGIGCPANGTYAVDGVHPPLSDASAHICVQCGGQFTVAVRAPVRISTTETKQGGRGGTGGAKGNVVRVGYASLMAGAWGRLDDLPVRADAAAILKMMGITMIRWGGSYTTSRPMPWTRWIGPAWRRPSAVDGVWGAGGRIHAVMSGWGWVEMADAAHAVGATPVLTLDPIPNGAPEGDMADFVEYCWGNASTEWGARRVADGHPAPINVTFVELGNEEYNANFVDQVKAMEARASAVGVPIPLQYLWPNNKPPNATDGARAAALGLGDRLLIDIHNGPEGGSGAIDGIVANPATASWGMLNGETNCGDHTVRRMISEATDLNMYFDRTVLANRIKGRTGSFCMERSGYNEGGLNDQGISFFLPNMTWLQPPGLVHAMVASTFQPNALNYSAAKCPFYLTDGLYSVQASDDRKTVVVRVVWDQSTVGENVTIDFGPGVTAPMEVTTMAWPDLGSANTPADPRKIAPRTLPPTVSGTVVYVEPYSYTVFVATFP